MKKLTAIILVQFIFVSSSLGGRFGLKTGINHYVLDPGERFRNLTGTGFHAGIDAGFDIRPCFAINITPQIKSSSYLIGMWPGTDYHYTNLFLPAVVSLKLLSTQSTSPYLGIGIAMNFQLYGKKVATEWGTEQPIEDLRNDIYFVTILGIEAKFARLRISPELSFNYNLTDNLIANHWGLEDRSVSIYDFALTICLCYSL